MSDRTLFTATHTGVDLTHEPQYADHWSKLSTFIPLTWKLVKKKKIEVPLVEGNGLFVLYLFI